MTTNRSTSRKQSYVDAADRAKHDMTSPVSTTTDLPGQTAAACGRDLLQKTSWGRPSIDPDAKPGHRSPRRQVRLPAQLSAALDEMAHAQHRNASALLRDALTEYLTAHRAFNHSPPRDAG